MARGGFDTDRVLVKVTVDMDVTEFPALEAGLVIVEVVMGQGYVIVTAGPPDFSMGEGDFFLFS